MIQSRNIIIVVHELTFFKQKLVVSIKSIFIKRSAHASIF